MQNEDKDRQIRDLQSQLERSSLSPTKSKLRGKLTNAATQTERVINNHYWNGNSDVTFQ